MSDDKDRDAMRIDTDLIRALADLLTEKDLTEIEVEDEDRRIVVRRGGGIPVAVHAAPAQAQPAMPVAATEASAQVTEEGAASHPGAVKSPMVGTVYLSREPGAPPFVTAGVQVQAGDTLLIVEAMKVMNPIQAPRSGVVKQVLVQDSQPVEFDQPLVIIE